MDKTLADLAAHRPTQARPDIPGWGVDADPKNEPTYPMRDRRADAAPGMTWARPAQQATDVEVLQSIEHRRRPAVFGASTPPAGLSGAIRRIAFRYSESQWAHWLLLMLADRVNVIEGVLEDLGRRTAPNLFKERGLGAEWKHNRPAQLRRLAAGIAVTGAAAGLGWWLVHAARRR